jgi:enoyl-CoA hydratase/carnithine racemase
MNDVPKRITTDKTTPGYWRVTLNNPPINAIDDRMYDEVFDLVQEIESEPSLKVVTFESANPDFFIAHYSTAAPRSRFGTPRWIDAATRLAQSVVLSIAVIRGRVRGGGSEFTLACDVRFASRERAIFGQPEVGTGLIPGGGALQRLPLLVGRPRAIEIILGADDFDAETAERYGWINAPFRRRNSTASSATSCGGSYRSTSRRSALATRRSSPPGRTWAPPAASPVRTGAATSKAARAASRG